MPHGVLENVAQADEEHDLPESVAGNIQCLELAVPSAALGRRQSVVAAAAGFAGPLPASRPTSEGCSDSDSSCAWPRTPLVATAAVVDWSSGSARME